MHNNLKYIGLEQYLNRCYGNTKWFGESWLVALDNFVGLLEQKDKNTIKSKFHNKQEHIQQNDLVNEIMIACAYHPNARFMDANNEKTYDLFDDSFALKIEVKSLNEGIDEQERHQSDKYEKISNILSNLDGKEKIKRIKEGVRKKCNDHFNKAVRQLNNCGKIYLIWDYNLLFGGQSINSLFSDEYLKNEYVPKSKEFIFDIIHKCVNDFLKCNSSVNIEVIYFGDLREKVANFIN